MCQSHRHRRRFSKIPCSIDESLSPFYFLSFWRSLLLCVFTAGQRGKFSLSLNVGSPLCLYQIGGMRHFGQGRGRGARLLDFRLQRWGKRAFWYGHGMAGFFFHSWLFAWEATRMKGEAKLKIAFSNSYERGQGSRKGKRGIMKIATGKTYFGWKSREIYPVI